MQNAGHILKHIHAPTALAMRTDLIAAAKHLRFYFLETMTDVSDPSRLSQPTPFPPSSKPFHTIQSIRVNSYHQSHHSLWKMRVC